MALAVCFLWKPQISFVLHTQMSRTLRGVAHGASSRGRGSGASFRGRGSGASGGWTPSDAWVPLREANRQVGTSVVLSPPIPVPILNLSTENKQ